MTTTAEALAPAQRTPWIGMWFAPRATVADLVQREVRPSWVPVVLLAGINQSLLWLANGSGDPLTDWGNRVGSAVFYGFVQLLYGVWISAFLIALLSGPFGGDGDADDVRLAIAWSYVPVAVTLVFWVPLFAAFGWAALTLTSQEPDASPSLAVLLFLPLAIAPAYSFILQVGAVAAALRVSIWRALAILAVLAVPALLLLALVR